MSFASDQLPNQENLSPTAKQMLALRDTVLAEWDQRVRATVKQAANLAEPILINTMPALYENIVEAVSYDSLRSSDGVAATTVAAEHGNERARLTNYDLGCIVTEYQVLRSTIFDVLERNNVLLGQRDVHVINTAIDAIIREAATAFALVQGAFRERFVAMLAHDLRNPLNVVQASADMIARSSDLNQIKNHAAKIKQNIGRMDQMIRELLDVVVFEHDHRMQLTLSNFDVMDLVNPVCDQSTMLYGARFKVIGKQVVGWWSRDMLTRALENLIGNAVKYGDKEQPITITVETAHGRMLLSVHNEGQAIPPDQLESVFHVFQRAKIAKGHSEHGWGLGLPFVRGVSESHGGSIGADSSAAAGTTFLIDIPIDARPFMDTPTLE
jgi:signal transduction histidine kinase